MIHSAEVKNGWPSKLKAIEGKQFSFSSGVNIIFGPNGCGKTTLLRILGAYCGCEDLGGWSEFVKPTYRKRKSYPEAFSRLAPGGRKGDLTSAVVEWDGMATFLHMAHKSDEALNHFGMGHDLLSDMERLSSMMGGMSAGQERLKRISALCDKLQNPPDMTVVSEKVKNANDLWKSSAEDFAKYAAECRDAHGEGPITCLLDEPTRSLDIVATVAFWRNVVPKLAKNCQLIIATHSPILLLMDGDFFKEFNFIDMREGYVDLSKAYLNAAINNEPLPGASGDWWQS